MITKAKTTAKNIKTLYILAKENDQYSIICVEENLNDKTLEVHKGALVSSKKRIAKGIFKKIVSGKVLAYTLLDVIYNILG
jgi:hypothetical protein